MKTERTTLLIAENDTFTRTSMTAFLIAEGFEVLKLDTCREALRCIGEVSPDLIVTDLKLPGLNGIEFIRVLTREFPELPVIITSCADTMANVIEALQIGACDYLLKPIRDMGLLLHSIKMALSHSRLRVENRHYRAEIVDIAETIASKLDLLDTSCIKLISMSEEWHRHNPLVSALTEPASQRPAGEAGQHISEPHCQSIFREIPDLISSSRDCLHRLEGLIRA